MTPIAIAALIGWMPVCVLLFALLSPVRALTLSYVLGWLFLPVTRIPVEGFWDIDKVLVTNVGALIGVVLFSPGLLSRYRFHAADLLLVGFASGVCMTSLANGLGLYDGLSSFSRILFLYAIPFLLGRLILKDRAAVVQAARLIIVLAALYAFLALFEWRMSPQIHKGLYGVFQHSWAQHHRWGFWRPIVCFQHGLALGIFFTWVSLLGIGLIMAGQTRSLMGVPLKWIVALPLIGLLVSMSLGPWLTFFGGLVLLLCWQRMRLRWLVFCPVLFAGIWMAGRYTGVTDGHWLTEVVSDMSEERAASLRYRIDAEDLLLDRAKIRPVLGWGGWGRNRIRNEQGRDLVATDGLWIIVLGSYGLIGLASFYMWWCWPVILHTVPSGKRTPDPVVVALLLVFGLQSINLLFNGFLSPILVLMNGAVISCTCGSTARSRSRRRRAPTLYAPALSMRAPDGMTVRD